MEHSIPNGWLKMSILKRVVLFLLLNFLVVFMISLVLNLLNIRPYLDESGIHLPSLLAFCFIWGMGGALISLSLSRLMAKWAMGVKLIDPNTKNLEESHLLEMVYGLAREAGLSKMPQVGIFRSPEPNAFATGPSQSRSLVAVSTGLLEKMTPNQVRGVLGHEIAHIVNGDMVTMTLLQGVVNAFVMFLARALAYALSGLGKNRDEGNRSHGSFLLLTYLFEVVFLLLGSLIICAYSRYREYKADAGGARLAGKENMIGALEALLASQKIHDPKTESPAIAAFKVSRSGKRGLLRFFSSHPPLEDRIARLRYSDLKRN